MVVFRKQKAIPQILELAPPSKNPPLEKAPSLELQIIKKPPPPSNKPPLLR